MYDYTSLWQHQTLIFSFLHSTFRGLPLLCMSDLTLRNCKYCFLYDCTEFDLLPSPYIIIESRELFPFYMPICIENIHKLTLSSRVTYASQSLVYHTPLDLNILSTLKPSFWIECFFFPMYTGCYCNRPCTCCSRSSQPSVGQILLHVLIFGCSKSLCFSCIHPLDSPPLQFCQEQKPIQFQAYISVYVILACPLILCDLVSLNERVNGRRMH